MKQLLLQTPCGYVHVPQLHDLLLSISYSCEDHALCWTSDKATVHMQGMLTREKEERARIVLTLRETIGAMKNAAQAEAQLRQQLSDLQEELAAAQEAEVSQ